MQYGNIPLHNPVVLTNYRKKVIAKVNPEATDRNNPIRIFGEQDFPVVVVVANSSNFHENFDLEFHPELEFHLIRHGGSQYFINGENYPCEKNSILIMHENEPHAWLINQKYADKNMTMCIDPRILEGRKTSGIALHRLESIHHLALADKQANTAEFLLNEISEECNNHSIGWQEVVTGYVEAFLAILYRASEEQISIIKSKDGVVQGVIEYLEKGFTGKVSLVEVAKLFNMSPYGLSRKFKQHTGLGFREYLIHRRIVGAQKLLVETDLKVASIATKVGFDSLTTFNRDFRLITSVTPAVYRTISETRKHED